MSNHITNTHENSLSDPNYIKALLNRHGFSFSKKLGQNFLVNPEICPKMVRVCEAGEDTAVLEIGPGIGVLTKELAKQGGEVVSVEIDDRLIPILNETLSGFDNVRIISGDILNLDIKQLLKDEFKGDKISICANLPYYITSPIIMHLLENKLPIETITVMVQKEAAERLCAAPGTRESGAVTLAVQYYAEPEIAFNVSAGSFMPAPKVDSAVIKLKVRKSPAVAVKSEKCLFALIKSGFGQRRKTLSNSLLGSGYFENKAQLNDSLTEVGISPLSRAENLTLEDWAKISDSLK